MIEVVNKLKININYLKKWLRRTYRKELYENN
jgi:hypothetical protein